jgi:hypothetical protein
MSNTATRIVAGACVAGLFALSARAAEPDAETGGTAPAAPTVTLPESTVLPNAPNVGDTAVAPTVAPNAPKVGDTYPSTTSEKAPIATTAGNPDWPCVQRKVMTISPAQVWDGPPIDDVKGWENDEKIEDLTTYLVSRRISLDDAGKAIKEFAVAQPEAERDKRLTMLFASVLSKTNTDRQFVLGRIEEFQRRQKGRSDELQREGEKLAKLNQELPPDQDLGPRDAPLTPEQQEYNWNARIFQERQQNLTVACEIPILIEQRVYEIAKLIREQMSS